MTTTLANDPVASGSEQFGLARPRHAAPCHDLPSPVGIRPWGLRGMRCGAVTGRAVPDFMILCTTTSSSSQSTGKASR